MVNLSDNVAPNMAGGDHAMAGGDAAMEEDLFPENLTKLSKSQALSIRGAKKLEQQYTQIEMEFFAKVHHLEAEYQTRFQDLINKRAQLLNGTLTVAENEVSDVPILYNVSEKSLSSFNQGLKDDTSSKVPEFWVNVLQHCEATAVMIEDADIPILKHLKDIESEIISEPMGFVLRFHFEPNEYFDNTVIEQKITYKLVPNDIHVFESPKVLTLENTPIKWKAGKDPRDVPDEKDQHSFFSMFDQKQDEEDMEDIYSLASLIREQVIPHATLYFTGELFDDDMSFGDASDSDESEENESMIMEE